ncbi:MAG TPA: Vms1/Ankzf1 family peptidyl-tRNA hydrolase [Mycobacteriales bacterium]|nr:Vms1/Ankzf1 family peptidyl-tRNA hydrolase [Mycobacteriales bacterium]
MELSDLTPVLTAQGPFVTVHVGAESAVEQAADRYDLVWRNVEKRLGELGVPAEVVEAVLSARGEHSDGDARLVIAGLSEGRVLLSEPVATRPPVDVVEVRPLAHVLPLISDVTARVPHVVVTADRTGADVTAYFDTQKVAHEVTVKGRTLHLKKVQGGGWAHHRYQHRSENQWKENGEDIADTAQQLAAQVEAELIIGVGDEREVSLVQKALPPQWADKYVVVPGGRGEGGEDFNDQRARDAVALHVAHDTLQLLEEFAQERGQVKRACDGLEDVVHALRKAQVESLLLTTELTRAGQDGPVLFWSEEPTVLGLTADEVTGLGAASASEGPAVDVLVRAAVATGAQVFVVPHEPATAPNGGVGAVLRYADDDNAAARA